MRVSLVDTFVVMRGLAVSVNRMFVRSMIGKESEKPSANGLLSKGERLVIGENTTIHR